MNQTLHSIRNWFKKQPSIDSSKTTNIDQAFQELRDLNKRQTEILQSVQQPDILRSLVISMNSGRNQ